MKGSSRPSPARAVVASLLIVAASAAATVPASADLRDDQEAIQRRQAKIQAHLDRIAEREDRLIGEITRVDTDRALVEREVRLLDGKVARLSARIGTLENRLTVAQQEVSRLTEELQLILEDLDARRTLFVERAVASYKAGPAAYVDGLLESESFADLLDRYAYYESALDADAELIGQIETLRTGVETRRAAVQSKQEEIALAKLELEADRQEVAAVRAERESALGALKQVLGEKRAVLGDVESSKRHYLAIQAQLQREDDQITALLTGRSSGGPLPVGGGQLLWPAAGPVTSSFGYRTHPIFGDRRFHAGIDIGAPYGAPVIASDAGIVVFAGGMSGYGNSIAIDHGGGLATTYNHLSVLGVAPGQRVGRGARIGAVGCTGYCTGPHLHFEVRVNGSPVDPMPYLQ